MHIMTHSTWSHSEIAQIGTKWTEGTFYEFCYISLFQQWRRKHIHTNLHPPFFGFSVGYRDVISHFSYSWVALDVISTPFFFPSCSFPRVTPGCCEPNPLKSSHREAHKGTGWAQRNPAVRVGVRGLTLLFLRYWNISSSQGKESSRLEHITLKLFVIFSLSVAD